jgi:hypothetical protein
MKTASTFGLFVLAALAIWASPARAANYNPATTLVVYIHGHDPNGYMSTGTFGDEFTAEAYMLATFANALGAPMAADDPTAPNSVGATTYYGSEPPDYYDAADIAEDAALSDVFVHRYALRLAKYIRHRLEDHATTATGVALMSGSFGTEVSRYMIEHDLLGLASSEKIVRWVPVVGMVQGAYAAGFPELIRDLLDESPEADEMSWDWVTNNISPRQTLNTALYGPMLITQFVGTADTTGYLTFIANEPNDSILLCTDEYFNGYTTSAALHPATDGTLQMPGLCYLDDAHGGSIAEDPGMYAAAVGAIKGNKRVTMKISRFKPKKAFDTIWGVPVEPSEYVIDIKVRSPQAANPPCSTTAPIYAALFYRGVAPFYAVSTNTTITPNTTTFNQLVMPGETQLIVYIGVNELDWWHQYYDMWEPGDAYRLVNEWTRTISINGNGVTTVSATNSELDLSTTVKYVY